MADSTLSALSAIVTPADTNLLYTDDGASDLKITLAQVRTQLDTFTGARTVQASVVAPSAGLTLALSSTAPAATTGASQAGMAVSLTASNAVASTDTAGAAAGGDVTIAAGNAARLTSGNADGGDINLLPGASVGVVSGGVGNPGWVYVGGVRGSGADGFIGASGTIGFITQDTVTATLRNTTGFSMRTDGQIRFATGFAPLTDSPGAIINKPANGLIGIRGANTSTGAAISLIEQTAPSAPSANGVYIYAQDNGAGKTQLMALFASGAAQQLAIEP